MLALTTGTCLLKANGKTTHWSAPLTERQSQHSPTMLKPRLPRPRQKEPICDSFLTDLFQGKRTLAPIGHEIQSNSAAVVAAAASFVPAGSRLSQSPHQSRWLVCALGLTGICTFGWTLMAIFLPDKRGVLLREDGIIEMASVVWLSVVVLAAGLASAFFGVCGCR